MSAEEDVIDLPDLSSSVRITEYIPYFVGNYSYIFRGILGNENVAIKVIRTVPGSSLHAMRRKSRREREVWAVLSHINVAPIYGFAEDEAKFGQFGAFISPWYEEGDAEQFLGRHGKFLPFATNVALWERTVAGVRYLHQHVPSIVHGDLKLRNILIDDHWQPKLCDFGLSRIFLEDSHSGMTTTTEHSGTERYLSPELVMAEEIRLPTTASDIHALGSIGLELIFSLTPYGHRKNNAYGHIFEDIKNGVPPARRPETVNDLEDTFWTLFEWCWQVNPTDRPAVDSLHDGIRSWLESFGLGPIDSNALEIVNIASSFLGHSKEQQNDIFTRIFSPFRGYASRWSLKAKEVHEVDVCAVVEFTDNSSMLLAAKDLDGRSIDDLPTEGALQVYYSTYEAPDRSEGEAYTPIRGMRRDLSHNINCSGCGNKIIGIRFQCACCPSPDGHGYSLCERCEVRSYQFHDPMHCFFKLPRPLDRMIQENEPPLSPMYSIAAGPGLSLSDPRGYLQKVRHKAARCDLCVTQVIGEWFHCVYCGKDLCSTCEALSPDDPNHISVVFKAYLTVDGLRDIYDEASETSRQIIRYPVYNASS